MGDLRETLQAYFHLSHLASLYKAHIYDSVPKGVHADGSGIWSWIKSF